VQNGSQLSRFLGAAFSPIVANQYNQNFQFFEGHYCAGKIERVSARAQRYRVLYADQWMPAACGPWPGGCKWTGIYRLSRDCNPCDPWRLYRNPDHQRLRRLSYDWPGPGRDSQNRFYIFAGGPRGGVGDGGDCFGPRYCSARQIVASPQSYSGELGHRLAGASQGLARWAGRTSCPCAWRGRRLPRSACGSARVRTRQCCP
jgi:hypothetical protein